MYSEAIKENLKLCSAHELRRWKTWKSSVHSVHMVCTACCWCAQCAQNKKCAHIYKVIVICAHYHFLHQIHPFMCTLFTQKSQNVSANCPISPSLLAIQAATGPSSQKQEATYTQPPSTECAQCASAVHSVHCLSIKCSSVHEFRSEN